MGIVRYEKVKVYSLTFSTTDFGEQNITKTLKFESAPIVSEVKNSLAITEKYRVYSDLINLKFNYTPNTRDMVDNQNLYSIEWRGKDWRIDSARETDNRMNVIFLCYRNDPETQV